jgi:hypothetical protein
VTLPRLGWSGQVSIATTRGCQWQVTSDASWLHVKTAGGSGSGGSETGGTPSTDACLQPLVSGECAAFFLRWGFNGGTGQCEEFVYGGCGANENNFETEAAMNRYLAAHRNAPFKTLREILLSGLVVPSRARTLMNAVGKTTDDPGYLRVLRIQEETRQVVLAIMADHNLDALMYTTYDHQPGIIADDVMTRQVVEDVAGFGHNRRLSPLVGCPAIAVPAGFTPDGLPVGIEFMTRPFTEPLLFRLAYAFEQRTRHRKPPASTQALRH